MLTQLLQAAQAVSAGAVPARQMGARLAAVLNTGDATAVPALVAATPDEDGLRVVVHGWGAVVADGVHVLNGWVDQVIADRRTFFVGRNTVTPVAPVEGSGLDLEDGVVLGDGVSFVLEPALARSEAALPTPPPAPMSAWAATPIEDLDPNPVSSPDPAPAAAAAPDSYPDPAAAPDPTSAPADPGLAAPDSTPGPAPRTPPAPLTTIWGLPVPAAASAPVPEDPGPEPAERDPQAAPGAADTDAEPSPTASPAPGEAAGTDPGPATTGSPVPDQAASTQPDPTTTGWPAPGEPESTQADPAPTRWPGPGEAASTQADPAPTGWPVPGAAADDQPEPAQAAPSEPGPYGQVQPAPAEQPLSAAAPAGPPAAALPAGRLVLDDGSSALLERSCVLGTAPHGSPAVQTGTAIPLTVEGVGIAPVHAEVLVEQGRAGVRDLGSAVTYLLVPGSPSWAPLIPGQITTLTPGMRIAIGQRTIAYELA